MIIPKLLALSLAIFVNSRFYQAVAGENPQNQIPMRGEEI
jgi:hypothetical protein